MILYSPFYAEGAAWSHDLCMRSTLLDVYEGVALTSIQDKKVHCNSPLDLWRGNEINVTNVPP